MQPCRDPAGRHADQSGYVLFAAMSGSLHTVLLESVGTTVFIIAAVVGFRSSDWIVAAALAGHAIFDQSRTKSAEQRSRVTRRGSLAASAPDEDIPFKHVALRRSR